MVRRKSALTCRWFASYERPGSARPSPSGKNPLVPPFHSRGTDVP